MTVATIKARAEAATAGEIEVRKADAATARELHRTEESYPDNAPMILACADDGTEIGEMYGSMAAAAYAALFAHARRDLLALVRVAECATELFMDMHGDLCDGRCPRCQLVRDLGAALAAVEASDG